MNFQIEVVRRAHEQLEAAVRWWADNRSPQQARRWYVAARRAILSLSNNPQRCPRALEGDRLPGDVRDLYFGVGRRRTHRLVFKIRGNVVIVVAVRHLAHDELTSRDIE